MKPATPRTPERPAAKQPGKSATTPQPTDPTIAAYEELCEVEDLLRAVELYRYCGKDPRFLRAVRSKKALAELEAEHERAEAAFAAAVHAQEASARPQAQPAPWWKKSLRARAEDLIIRRVRSDFEDFLQQAPVAEVYFLASLLNDAHTQGDIFLATAYAVDGDTELERKVSALSSDLHGDPLEFEKHLRQAPRSGPGTAREPSAGPQKVEAAA